YVRFIDAAQQAGIDLHYAAHITGHGWRKLMRLEEPFVYRMTDVGRVPAIFEFLERAGPIDEREMYATFNMGAGFAVYVDPKDATRCMEIAKNVGQNGWVGGSVVKDGMRKAVEIQPLKMTFDAESLQVR